MRKRFATSLSSIPTATGGIARLVCNRLRQEGRNVRAILLRAGLSTQSVESPKSRLEAGAQVRLLELAAEELQDDYLGFRLARDFELGEIGLVYYVMASSERLSEALTNAERYCAINNEGVRLQVHVERELRIGLEYLNLGRHSDRHHAEFWVVTLIRVVRALTNGRLAPKQIKLRHQRSEIPADVQGQLGCMIDDAADRDEITFPALIASLPVVGADTHLNRLLLEYANDALGRHTIGRDSLRSQVETTLVQLLPNGKGNFSEVARQLGLSRRTLARALSGEGTTFSAVLRNLRHTLAKRYLQEKNLPISEIAWLLGYREVSSFTHAFAGWTGLSPREFRASC